MINRMKNKASELLKRYADKVDYLEIRLQSSVSNDIAIQTGAIDNIASSFDMGGAVRALYRGAWGFSCFTGAEVPENAFDSAVAQARALGTGKSILAAIEPVVAVAGGDFIRNSSSVSLKEKLQLLLHYDSIINSYAPKTIIESSVNYNDENRTIVLLTSEGTDLTRHHMDMAFNAQPIAKKGDHTERIPYSNGSTIDFSVIEGQDENIKEVCELTLKMIDAPRVKAGTYTVICDPQLTGVFAHEAFGHLSEADAVAENPSLQNTMKLGRRFGRDILNIYDTGLDEGTRGWMPYDDEGVPGEKTDLIKEGILTGRLHSRETAGKLGEKPTGSCRAMNFMHIPIPRMRNTCVAPGKDSFEDMLSDIKLGIYASDYLCGTGGEMFTFTSASARMIRNGKLEEYVRDVKLTGNVFATLMNIDAVGNDFLIKNSSGGCGKEGQWPLPTSESGPHIRIQNVIVGGEE